jgi:hypothetical protein
MNCRDVLTLGGSGKRAAMPLETKSKSTIEEEGEILSRRDIGRRRDNKRIFALAGKEKFDDLCYIGFSTRGENHENIQSSDDDFGSGSSSRA